MHNHKKLYAVLFFLMLAGIASASGKTPTDKIDYYRKGKRALENGHPKKALRIWLQAKGALKAPSARIGIAYIQLVAQKKYKDDYEYATLMYYWGLSAQKVASNKQALEGEIKRLGVLVDHKTYHHWHKLWKENDPNLYKSLLKFWKQLDPTPATTYNERLMEHWQRIAYSHKHFTKGLSGAFGADDRAKIYVRYGAPDVKRHGYLKYEGGVAEGYIYQISNRYGCSASSNLIEFKLRQVREGFNIRPRYAVWVYYNVPSREQKNIFIFGSLRGTGKFKVLHTLEDLFPPRSFTATYQNFQGIGSCIANIRPALVLQIMYYDQLAALDPFFGDNLDRIIRRATSGFGAVSRSLPRQISSDAQIRLEAQKQDAPQQSSTIGKHMLDIPLKVYQYRLLNNKNQPYIATFVISRPQKSLLIDYLKNYSKNKEKTSISRLNDQIKSSRNYEFTNVLQLYNKNGDLQSQLRNTPDLVTDNKRASGSLFMVPAVAEGAKEKITAKVTNTDPHSTYADTTATPFLSEVRGLGETEIEQPSRLDNNTERLQMSDLIMGYDYHNSPDLPKQFPFVVANDHKIPAHRQLALHFEIYHLKQNINGIYLATFSYQIRPKKKGLLKFLKKKQKSKLKLTLNLQSKKPAYRSTIQIKTRNLVPGGYIMEVATKDSTSHQQVKRNFEFEVVDKK